MKKRLPKLVVVLGPTASGKSDLAIKLAKKFNGEIVNADSRSIYRGMLIGTASPFAPVIEAKPRRTLQVRRKVGPKEGGLASTKIKKISGFRFQVSGIKHHLFHFIDPWEMYSVGQYKQDATEVINDIIARGKLPILVGGTGLYIWAVVDNLEIPEVPPNLKLRKQLMTPSFVLRLRQKLGIDRRVHKKISKNSLLDILLKLDPEAASFIQKDNPRRVIRALEVFLTINKSRLLGPKHFGRFEPDKASIIKFSELRKKGKPPYNALQIGLKIPRQELCKRINKRVDKQIKDGLVEETRRLFRKISYSNVLKNTRITNIWNLPSTTSLSYRQIGMYLRGEVPLEEATRLLKRDTRHYARRQMTWFRRDKRIKWTKIEEEVLERLRKFFSK